MNTPDTPSDDGGVAAESGSPAYEAQRAGALRKLAEVLGRVDAGSLTAEQLQTMILEMDFQFGVPAVAREGSADPPGDAREELQATLDRLAVGALTAASDAERRICDQIVAFADVDDGHAHDPTSD